MTICAHCDERIQGTPQPVGPDLGTGAAPTVYVCPYACRPAAPRQTSPSSGRRAIREV